MTPIPGLEVRELDKEQYADSLAGDLSLEPLAIDELRAKLVRAGFVDSDKSARSAFREEVKI